jgi:hypothetical protein
MRESITNILSHLYKEISENSPLLFITLWVVGWLVVGGEAKQVLIGAELSG